MSRLLIMRHAAAQYATREAGDRQRPLTEAGRQQAAEMGRRLAERNEVPVKLFHSDAQRCVETARAMLAVWPRRPEVIAREDMYLASDETLGRIAGSAFQAGPISDDASCLFLAHNPGVSNWVRNLAGTDPEARTSSLATADVAVFEFDSGIPIDETSRVIRFVEFLRSHR